jgi:hypothetical protein
MELFNEDILVDVVLKLLFFPVHLNWNSIIEVLKKIGNISSDFMMNWELGMRNSVYWKFTNPLISVTNISCVLEITSVMVWLSCYVHKVIHCKTDEASSTRTMMMNTWAMDHTSPTELYSMQDNFMNENWRY